MKKFTFKGVLDGFRSSVAQQVKPEQEIVETLRSEHFQVKKTFKHGFPHQPICMAYDPVQKLLAIGTKTGSLRILGAPGVDVHVKHDCAVLHLQFLINEGALVSSTADETIHLWNFRQKVPQVVQSLKFQRDKITCIHLPLQSKWLYIGTDRGNIHFLHIETFVLSGYVINWNKAIELSRKNHPGPVVHISDNPLDISKLLIGYETGIIVLWDLKVKAAEFRWITEEAHVGTLKSVSWHHEGKQFMSSYNDGSLITWSVRQVKPINVTHPHAKNMKDDQPEPCKPIQKVEWKLSRSGEAYVVFSGGLAYETTGRTPSITVIQGKTTTVLEMEHNVVDFITLCDSPWTSDYQDPYAVVVLLQNDLVVIDLLTTGFPCFENPYPMDLHESPVTCCAYFADCPGDLIPAFYSVGKTGSKKTGFSEHNWPISGGEWNPNSSSYSEIILTGHADGSIKFWDSSAGSLQVLYKLKTAKLFEKSRTRSLENDEDPLAIQLIFLCPESRKLAVAGAGRHVILFKFKKVESMSEVTTLTVSLVADPSKDTERSPDFDFSNLGDDPKANAEKNQPLKVKSGVQKRAPGFQASLICLTHGPNGELPESITALSLNSSYGLLAYGNDIGLVVVDIVQKVTLLVMCTSDLGGGVDPHQLALRSPKRHEDGATSTTAKQRDADDKARSPSVDQQQQQQHQQHQLQQQHQQQANIESSGISSSNSNTFGWKSFKLKRQLSKLDFKIKSPSATSFLTTPTSQDVTSHHQQQQQQHHLKSCSASDNHPRTLSPVQSIDVETPQSPTAEPIVSSDNTSGQVSVTRESLSPTASATAKSSNEDVTKLTSGPNEAIRPTELALNETTTRAAESSSSSAGIKPPMRFKRVVRSLQAKRAEARLNSKLQKQQQSGGGGGGGVECDASTKHSDDGASGPGPPPPTNSDTTFAGNFLRRFNKLDSSFQRSRSSSMSSLENIATETVSCLTFADSYTKKSDSNALPTLWIGTSSGSVQTIVFNTPASGDRHAQPVIISSCNGTTFKLKGCILTMSFLDCNGALIPYSYESWRDESGDGKDRHKNQGKFSSTRMSPSINSQGSATDGHEDRQFVVLTSEKQARVVALPSQNCVYKQQLTETHIVIKAEITSMKDSVCLVCYVSNGHICTYSLPSLRPLVDIDFLPVSDLRIARTLCFTNRGHGLYLASPTEIQKFTISSEFCVEMVEMIGDIFIVRDMPEPPKESFFKGLFGGGTRTVDREELFGEASGKPLRTTANRIAGPNAGTEALRERVSTATGDVAMAHQMVMERGDKLSQLEERTGRMMNESENFASSAHSLMQKYKDKKWYQL